MKQFSYKHPSIEPFLQTKGMVKHEGKLRKKHRLPRKQKKRLKKMYRDYGRLAIAVHSIKCTAPSFSFPSLRPLVILSKMVR
jgi:hypothetical protein